MEETSGEAFHKPKPQRLIDSYVVQCGKCSKWRFINTQEEYEEIRSKSPETSFECKRSCEEPSDVDVECDSTRVWFVDQHGVPKTPKGFKRIVVPRESYDKVDVYYITPQGKRLRSCNEVAGFIKDNENFKDTDMEDVSFVKPKVLKKTKRFITS